MLQVIISIIGLIIAVFVFALIADKFPSITNCIPLAIFVFVLLWGASICISYSVVDWNNCSYCRSDCLHNKKEKASANGQQRTN